MFRISRLSAAGSRSLPRPCAATASRVGIVGAAMLAVLVGCTSPEPTAPQPAERPAASDVPLRVLVAGDPSLADALPAAWQSVSEQPLDVRRVAPEALGEAAGDADAILFPAMQMGDAVRERWITPLPDAWLERTGGAPDVFPQIAEQQMRWNDRWYGLSLGCPVPAVLLGRQAAAEEGELRSWQQWDAAAERLAEAGAPGAAEPLAPGWAAKSFLARAAAYVEDGWVFTRHDLRPRLTEPAFVAALNDLVAASAHYPETASTPEAIWTALGEGTLQQGIGWPTGPHADASPLRVAPLPASRRASDNESEAPLWIPGDGLIAAVARSARQSAAARSLVRWAASSDGQFVLAKHSPVVMPTGAAPVERQTPSPSTGVPEYDRYLAERLGPTVAVKPMLRLPGAREYLAALDQQVREAILGRRTPEEALAAAAERWEAITARRGRDQQRADWLISQGLPAL